MRTWLRQHRQGFTAATLRFANVPMATLFNAFAIAVSLALPLIAYILVFNVQALAHHADDNSPQMNVFLANDATRKDADNIERVIEQSSAVRKLRFIAKDQALAELKRDEAVARVAGILETNPLPDAFIADLHPDAPAGADTLAAQLRGLPKVALVQLDSEWLHRVDGLLRLGKMAVAVLAALLAFALVAVTFNTVRMQIVTQRDEIEVSELIGATRAYIRRPFYYQGALLGLLGGLLALLLVVAAGVYLNPQVATLAESYGSDFYLRLPPTLDLLGLLGFAAFLGWLGAWLSVSRHLSRLSTG
jgi:cell division transport system permease protein